MSWANRTFQSQVDAAMDFINTGSQAYNPLPVTGSFRVGCIDSSQCGSGWSCEKGYCVPKDSRGGGSGNGESSGCGDGSAGGGGGSPCGAGGGGGGGGVGGCTKAGCGGFGGGGGGGGNADDCCGAGRCCRIGTGFVQCFCGDCPPPPSCNEFCSGYSAANGQPAPGCGDGDSCDECSRCVDQGNFQGSKCEPLSSGPCWCDNRSCRDCEKCTESGTCVEDCTTCLTCLTLFNWPCPCGDISLRCCWSACNGSPQWFQCSDVGCKNAGLADGDCDPPPPPDGGQGEPCDCNCNDDCPDCFICNAAGECEPDPNCCEDDNTYIRYKRTYKRWGYQVSSYSWGSLACDNNPPGYFSSGEPCSAKCVTLDGIKEETEYYCFRKTDAVEIRQEEASFTGFPGLGCCETNSGTTYRLYVNGSPVGGSSVTINSGNTASGGGRQNNCFYDGYHSFGAIDAKCGSCPS